MKGTISSGAPFWILDVSQKKWCAKKQTHTNLYVRLSKLLVWRIDINIIWKGPIANHSFVAILPSLGNID